MECIILFKQSKTCKSLWLLIVMGCLAIVIWQICSCLIYYFSWPTTPTVVVQYVENAKFPAVTFCTLNGCSDFMVPADVSEICRREALGFFGSDVSKQGTSIQMSTFEDIHVRIQEQGSPLVYTIMSVAKENIRRYTDYTGVPGLSKADVENAFLEMETILFIHVVEIKMQHELQHKEFTRKNRFYLNSSTLLECEFFGKPCYPNDFDHVFTEYGNCFAFNHNDLPPRRVSLPGKGLYLLFDVQQEELTDEPALGYTDAGLTFVIHSPEELPCFDGLGLLTPVSMHTQVAIHQLKSIIQEYPWGECKPDIKLQYHKSYSTNGCFQECKAWYIKEWCGCLPFTLPGNGTECDLLKFYNCVYPAFYDIEVKGLCTVGIHNSTCPTPSEETDYPTTVAYSSFGGEKAMKYFSTKRKKRPKYIRQNLVHIDIKYNDLSYKITQQQKALAVFELLADVGGQLGLFCDASMITIVELVEYSFTNFCWMCIFLLLKAPDMSQWNNPSQNQPTYMENKMGIQEC